MLARLLKHSDLAAAFAVVVVVVMMVVPLPAALVDLVITMNISAALAILIVTMYVPQALDFAAFPSLLLLTTLLRLAINVSVTRLILLHADAGGVIHTGAGGGAGGGARFPLEGIPGKQRGIDADPNAAKITEGAARARRAEI